MSNKNNLTLECIDGKDDFLIIPIPSNADLHIGHNENEEAIDIKEMDKQDGFITFRSDGSKVSIHAGNTSKSIKINGKPLMDGHVLGTNDVIKIGTSIWRINYPVSNDSIDQALFKKDSLHSMTGLEKLKDFKLADIFDQVFKKKSTKDMEDQLLMGTSRHQPELIDLEISWARPWLFSRFMLITVVLGFLMYIAMNIFNNRIMLPGVMFIGTFAMPLSVLIFFMEMNTPRNISIFSIISSVFAGGVASLLVTLILNDRFGQLYDMLGASSAGIIEEVAKLVIVVAIFGRNTTLRWGQNGMLLGAAIGCGFAAFESAGYAFAQLLENSMSITAFSDNIILRGVMAPFTHVIWTANAAAALWFVKGDQKFSVSMLFNKFFLRIMLSSMVLHMIWNSPLFIFPIPIFLDLKFLLLGILGLSISMRLIQRGLKQIVDTRKIEIDRMASN